MLSGISLLFTISANFHLGGNCPSNDFLKEAIG